MSKKNQTPETKEEILKEIAEAQDTIKSFNFGTAGSKSSHPHHKWAAKKKIAQLMTKLHTLESK